MALYSARVAEGSSHPSCRSTTATNPCFRLTWRRCRRQMTIGSQPSCASHLRLVPCRPLRLMVSHRLRVNTALRRKRASCLDPKLSSPRRLRVSRLRLGTRANSQCLQASRLHLPKAGGKRRVPRSRPLRPSPNSPDRIPDSRRCQAAACIAMARTRQASVGLPGSRRCLPQKGPEARAPREPAHPRRSRSCTSCPY